MNDLVTWLREQIADDQSYSEDRDTSGHCDWHEGIHLVNAEVQARCEAYLRIIDAAVVTWNSSCDPTDDFWAGLAPMMKAVLRNLALAYQHRPGYREEWK